MKSIINIIHRSICIIIIHNIYMVIISRIMMLITGLDFSSADFCYIIFCISTVLVIIVEILVFIQENKLLITIFNYIPRYITLSLARRANNGELFNKNADRDSMDTRAAFFYNISKIFDS